MAWILNAIERDIRELRDSVEVFSKKKLDDHSESLILLIDNVALLSLRSIPGGQERDVLVSMLAIKEEEQGKGKAKSLLSLLCSIANRWRVTLYAKACLIVLNGKGLRRKVTIQ